MEKHTGMAGRLPAGAQLMNFRTGSAAAAATATTWRKTVSTIALVARTAIVFTLAAAMSLTKQKAQRNVFMCWISALTTKSN
ncbi:hypothetical protein ACIOG3_05315 [Yersinia rochesterensis]|uniref:hypothetical protein n=1 Tax=Yersinia rochesterensis TaxID=1604335 RepID=UPI0006906612|nr:hypothetical protein [Yersinia rochesterensis]